MTVIDRLMQLGFTRYEAQAYTTLLQTGPLNGYELARASGVPRPNIYDVLRRLEQRGATQRIDEPGSTRYVALASDELVRRLREDFEQTLTETKRTLGELSARVEWEGVSNTHGYDAAMAAAKELIRSSANELLIAVWPQEAELLGDATAHAEANGVHITTLCLAGCSQSCGHCRGEVHRHRVDAGGNSRWLVLAADGSEVMTAEIGADDAYAVRTRQRLLVELAAWYVRHTIALASILNDLDDADPALLSDETRAILEQIGSAPSTPAWLSALRGVKRRAARSSAHTK